MARVHPRFKPCRLRYPLSVPPIPPHSPEAAQAWTGRRTRFDTFHWIGELNKLHSPPQGTVLDWPIPKETGDDGRIVMSLCHMPRPTGRIWDPSTLSFDVTRCLGSGKSLPLSPTLSNHIMVYQDKRPQDQGTNTTCTAIKPKWS